MGAAFYPPLLKRWMVWLVEFSLPLFYRGLLGGFQVRFDPASFQAWQKILHEQRHRRVLFLPNHPTEDDPFVMFDLARQMRVPFHYVAAREVFDLEGGLRGKLFQRVGVYSLIRGATDRESFRTTRRILAEGETPLVIFIEGEISYQNGHLIPFESGVLQLAYMAQEAVLKEVTAKTTEPKPTPFGLEDILVAPVALKYQCLENPEKYIEQGLLGLEMALSIPTDIQNSDSRYYRLRRIAAAILTIQEEQLNIPVTAKSHTEQNTEDSDILDERMLRVKNALLNRMERYLDIVPESHAEEPMLDRLRRIRNTIDIRTHHYTEKPLPTLYQQHLIQHEARTFKEFYRDLDRVVSFLIFKDGYVREKPTPERFMEMIFRLEKEVFGRPKTQVPRQANVTLGNPVSLLAHYAAYQQDKRGTLTQLTQVLEKDMQRLID
ncbi:MAG: 1-acyl-sn-glycerol-3-phosphate acyltransferase [Cyanobacteria bacterium]|nr:1-acyl-sn-glycerol-3-phosphate acyltransferase [Cyanobacteriota bacterium]